MATSAPTTVRIPLELSATARRELQRTRRLALTVAAQLGRQPVHRYAITLTRARG